VVVRPRSHEIGAGVVEGCRKGDRNAIRVIYDVYKDKVYSIALYFFHGDTATASDVTQQVFLKLVTDSEHFRGESTFSTWLYRIVVNTCIDAARGRRQGTLRIERSLVESVAAEGSLEDDLDKKQIADSIRTAISALPPKFRLAILLRYFDDLSYEEMAKVLNCSMGTVASRLSRGHRMLAAKLAPMREWFGKGQL
jgi:RNA polymerase sigma-70 factor (ECF subfamily)